MIFPGTQGGLFKHWQRDEANAACLILSGKLDKLRRASLKATDHG